MNPILELLKKLLGNQSPQSGGQSPIPTPTPTYDQYLGQYNVKGVNEPDSNYDYLGAYQNGVIPQKWTSLDTGSQIQDIIQMITGKRRPFNPLQQYMWPDQFKTVGHEVPPQQ